MMAKLLWPKDLQQVLGPPSAAHAGNNNNDDDDFNGSGSGLSSPSFSWMVDLHHQLMLPVPVA
jgi:hypothetical protein